jgi:hypothetical protein
MNIRNDYGDHVGDIRAGAAKYWGNVRASKFSFVLVSLGATRLAAIPAGDSSGVGD